MDDGIFLDYMYDIVVYLILALIYFGDKLNLAIRHQTAKFNICQYSSF